jgi:hypothetical protein
MDIRKILMRNPCQEQCRGIEPSQEQCRGIEPKRGHAEIERKNETGR